MLRSLPVQAIKDSGKKDGSTMLIEKYKVTNLKRRYITFKSQKYFKRKDKKDEGMGEREKEDRIRNKST